MMQNDLEITSKSQFWTQSMQNSTKTIHSDMSERSAGSWGTVEVWILSIFYGTMMSDDANTTKTTKEQNEWIPLPKTEAIMGKKGVEEVEEQVEHGRKTKA